MTCKSLLVTALILCLVFVAATPFPGVQAEPGESSAAPMMMNSELTPAQAYAAEVLAYLLQITLGMAGDPRYRDQWRVRGLHEPLDFENVVATMTQPERNPLDLMVLDPNILDLTTVLYHYDKGLSLYEGDYGVTSIYPAAEFIAIRLLLIQKIHKQEKVCLSAVMARKDLLYNPAATPAKQDLKAMNLTGREFKFLQEIIHSKPHLFHYLTSPCLVRALWEAGAVKKDRFVTNKIAETCYSRYPCRFFQGSKGAGAVKVCFVPSFTDEFKVERSDSGRPADDFTPTRFLLILERKLAQQIESAVKRCMAKELFYLEPFPAPTERPWWEDAWPKIAAQHLGFYAADQRPFAVYPENAAQAIRDICPQADFYVIILGQNVYKSIYFNPKTDSYPAVNRIYVDIMDIKHSQTQEAAKAAGCFISERIAETMLGELMLPPPLNQGSHHPN